MNFSVKGVVYMKIIHVVTMTALVAISGVISACSGGGGGGSSPGTVVNGVVQAGTFTKGKVAFKGYSGVNNTEFTVTPFKDFSSPRGAFSVNIGSYRGPLKIMVSGYYTDEATHKIIVVSESAPLKAVIPPSAITNGIIVPVTPLTDIAANRAIQDGMSSDAITRNNQGVAQLFGLVDVTKTIPAVPIAANMNSNSKENSYAVALVKMSDYTAQYAATSSGTVPATVTAELLQAYLPAALTQFSNGIRVTAGSGSNNTPTVAITAPELKDALSNVVSADALNNATANLQITKYDLKVTGDPATRIYGLQFAIPGMSLTANASGTVATGSVLSKISGGIINGTSKNSTLKLTYVIGTGFSPDASGVTFATLTSTEPASVAVSNPSVYALDKDGVQLSGVDVRVEIANN